MDKKNIIINVSAVLILLFTGWLFYAQMPRNQKVAENVVKEKEAKGNNGYSGQLEYAEGHVEKRIGQNDGWKEIEKGEIVGNGTEVRTLVNSRAVLTFEDGSLARLDENTQMRIVTEEKSINLVMPSGAVFNRVAKNADREYVVETSDYKMKALGTIFSVVNIDGDNPQLTVLESEVEMKKSDGILVDTAVAGEKIAINMDKMEKHKIKKEDLEADFIAWNIKEDGLEKEKERKNDDGKNKENEEDKKAKKFSLVGAGSDSGIELSWSGDNISFGDGFKIIKSKNTNPVYPGDDYQYVANNKQRSYKWDIMDGEKYHFRVCVYSGGKCSSYSNDVLVTAKKKKNDSDKSDGEFATGVSLKASGEGSKVKLSWSISGGSAPMGFKVVKSKDKNPVYPGNDYQYLSEKDTRNYTWSGLEKGKNYHFRVCIYKGGKCGAYSNDVEISL